MGAVTETVVDVADGATVGLAGPLKLQICPPVLAQISACFRGGAAK